MRGWSSRTARDYRSETMTIVRAAAVIALAAFGAACATTQAAAPIERPALEVPPAPPRLVEPVVLPQPIGPEPVEDLPPPVNTATRAKPSPTTAKPDPKTEPPPVDPPPAPPAVAPAVPPLRTPDSPRAAEATKRIYEITGRAAGLLNNTDFGQLSRPRQEQYLNAQLLINQAEAAIKAANFEFARNLAEKAERLAKELQGR
jgi:hypothetical protein